MVALKHPFLKESGFLDHQRVFTGIYDETPLETNVFLGGLIKGMLNINPEKRFTCKEIILKIDEYNVQKKKQ